MNVNLAMNAPRVGCFRIQDLDLESIEFDINEIIRDPVKLRAALERIMFCDGSAPASILGYYLDDIKDYYSCFCPLGYSLYETIGHAMRDVPEVLKIAIETGLVCGAVDTHVSCALDVWDNWDRMQSGILRLLEDPRFNVFIEYQNRVYIEALLGVEDEETWQDIVKEVQSILAKSEFNGY
jgi:hypothetical protein